MGQDPAIIAIPQHCKQAGTMEPAVDNSSRVAFFGLALLTLLGAPILRLSVVGNEGRRKTIEFSSVEAMAVGMADLGSNPTWGFPLLTREATGLMIPTTVLKVGLVASYSGLKEGTPGWAMCSFCQLHRAVTIPPALPPALAPRPLRRV